MAVTITKSGLNTTITQTGLNDIVLSASNTVEITINDSDTHIVILLTESTNPPYIYAKADFTTVNGVDVTGYTISALAAYISANCFGAAGVTQGAWTPVGNGITLSGAEGYYIRVGQMVTCFFQIVFPATADGSAATISGLPFPSVNIHNGAALGTSPSGYGIIANASSVLTIYTANGSGTTNAQNSSAEYYGSITYRTNS